MQVRPLSYALGLEVKGIDLRKPLDAETIATLRQLMLKHLVLCFPEQKLDIDEHQALVRQFGELYEVPMARREITITPSVQGVSNQPLDGRPWDGYKNGQNWHSDLTYSTRPPSFAFLVCKAMPQVGGDTMFANMYMAYESLSPTMRGIVDQLSAIHDREVLQNFEASPTIDPEFRERMQAASLKRANGRVPTVQPVARIHPETHRKALYLANRITRFVGMTPEETKPLLDFLMEHSVKYEFTYRHKWSVDDVIVWDNRCLMHIALCDYDLRNDPRVLYKCSLRGEVTGHDYGPTDEALATAASG